MWSKIDVVIYYNLFPELRFFVVIGYS